MIDKPKEQEEMEDIPEWSLSRKRFPGINRRYKVILVNNSHIEKVTN